VWLQYLIGIFMFIFSYYGHYIVGNVGDNTPPNILLLTGIFFALNFLAATQDIAVDGWALTMLSRFEHNRVATSSRNFTIL
jgi:PAT family acetyl-CoA transporter-like MFS transporter 1